MTLTRDEYASSAGARAAVVADFDRDGWADLAHATLDTASVSILLNGGGERLAFARDVPVDAGPFDLTAADFNRDGGVDLAVANLLGCDVDAAREAEQ